jgi:hypothetical protein
VALSALDVPALVVARHALRLGDDAHLVLVRGVAGGALDLHVLDVQRVGEANLHFLEEELPGRPDTLVAQGQAIR